MNRPQLGRRRGVSLPMAVALLLLVEALGVVAAAATVSIVRLSADDRHATEAWLHAASALAEGRVGLADSLPGIADGATVMFAWNPRPGGWATQASVHRAGSLLGLEARSEKRDAAGSLLASRRLTLLLDRSPSDTVRVLAHRPRF